MCRISRKNTASVVFVMFGAFLRGHKGGAKLEQNGVTCIAVELRRFRLYRFNRGCIKFCRPRRGRAANAA